MKQKFVVCIPTLEVTHIVGKRIFKTFKTKNQEALIRIIIQAIEKCVHLSFAPSITRPHQDVRGYITKYVCKPSDCFLGSFQRWNKISNCDSNFKNIVNMNEFISSFLAWIFRLSIHSITLKCYWLVVFCYSMFYNFKTKD